MVRGTGDGPVEVQAPKWPDPATRRASNFTTLFGPPSFVAG